MILRAQSEHDIMDSDGKGRQAVGVQGGRRRVRWDGGAKVLVEITSSTPAPRSIATTEVKAPRGAGEGGGGGEEEEEVEDEQ